MFSYKFDALNPYLNRSKELKCCENKRTTSVILSFIYVS